MNETDLAAAARHVETMLRCASPDKCAKWTGRLVRLKLRLVRGKGKQ